MPVEDRASVFLSWWETLDARCQGQRPASRRAGAILEMVRAVPRVSSVQGCGKALRWDISCGPVQILDKIAKKEYYAPLSIPPFLLQ